jgi:hypothetical protein
MAAEYGTISYLSSHFKYFHNYQRLSPSKQQHETFLIQFVSFDMTAVKI